MVSMRKLFLLVTLCCVSFFTNAQQSNRQLRLHALIGTKHHNFKSAFSPSINSQINTFALGAGSYFSFDRILVGAEFYYSTQSTSNNNEAQQYIGFSNGVLLGYNVLKNTTWKVEPLVGFTVSNNQVIAQDDGNTDFLNVKNNQPAITTGLLVTNVNSIGMCFGLKCVYNAALKNKSNWRYAANGDETGLEDNTSSLTFQLTIGGLLSLNKNQ
jgi:hypothetical protein